MSIDIERAPAAKRARAGRLEFRLANFDDYDQLARLESSTFGTGTPTFDEWRMLWHGHPLWPQIDSWWTIGWVLETTGGEIVGCMANVPLLYHLRGERLIAAGGKGWQVLPEHRAFGSAMRILREHFRQPHVDLVIDTSASFDAGVRGGRLAHRVPMGDWGSVAYFITGYRAFATRALQKLQVPLSQAVASPVGLGLRVKDALLAKRLPRCHSSFTIDATDRFDSRFDDFSAELLRLKPEILLAARDSATLSWHFAVPMRKRRLWIFTASRNFRLRAYCIFERKDVGEELGRIRLVDYQTIEPDADLLPALLSAALRRCVAEGVSVLDKPGVGSPPTCGFDEYAPYRRKQPWAFWYRASDPALATELRDPKFWEPSEYDGDASIG